MRWMKILFTAMTICASAFAASPTLEQLEKSLLRNSLPKGKAIIALQGQWMASNDDAIVAVLERLFANGDLETRTAVLSLIRYGKRADSRIYHILERALIIETDYTARTIALSGVHIFPGDEGFKLVHLAAETFGKDESQYSNIKRAAHANLMKGSADNVSDAFNSRGVLNHAAVSVMQQRDDAEMKALILEIHELNDSIFKIIGLEALGPRTADWAFDLIETDIASPETQVRTAAVRALFFREGERTFDILKELMNNPDSDLRKLALQAAELNNGPGSESVISKGLKDREPSVRKYAKEIAKLLGCEAIVQARKSGPVS